MNTSFFCGRVDLINHMVDYAEILARIETHLKISELNQLLATNKELLIKQKILNHGFAFLVFFVYF